MKGLIPAAGKGSRLAPFTRAIPKELLPVGDKAVIEHVIEMFKCAGILDITVIVGWRKHAILDYLGSGRELGVKITYAVQDEQNGLAMAINAGRHVINGRPFAVILGDNFYHPKDCLKKLMEFHEANGADITLGVVEVEDPARHGIITPDGINVIDMVEKPSREEAASNLGSAGMYIFSPEIFEAIENTKPGFKDEYQLTDSIKLMVEKGRKVLFHTIGTHIDVGTLDDLKKANDFILREEEKY